MRRYPKEGGQFAIIWADLLYEDSVPATGKLLFGEIYRRSDAQGWCTASNKDFMDLLGCSARNGAFSAAENWLLLSRRGYPQKIAGTQEVPAKI